MWSASLTDHTRFSFDKPASAGFLFAAQQHLLPRRDRRCRSDQHHDVTFDQLQFQLQLQPALRTPPNRRNTSADF
jgi:hypothetical protein